MVDFGGRATGAFVFMGAYLLGRGAEGSPTPTKVGTNASNPDCDTACSDYEKRRQERCSAQVAEAAAKAESEARDKDFNAAAVALCTATAAAFASAALPWPANLVAGLILWTIVTVALAAMMYFLGKKMVAGDAWAAAAKVLMDAQQAVNDARDAVLSHCPMDRADACLNRPPPC
jgi:hypothetical protein